MSTSIEPFEQPLHRDILQTVHAITKITENYVYIIEQARGQDGWILAEFSFCVFMDRDEVEVHKT